LSHSNNILSSDLDKVNCFNQIFTTPLNSSIGEKFITSIIGNNDNYISNAIWLDFNGLILNETNYKWIKSIRYK